MGKFRIKIKAWWCSDDYVQFIYSTNGIRWHKVHALDYDILDEWYYMRPLTVEYYDCERYINKFKTINDIHKYEQEEEKRVNENNNQMSKRDKLNKEKKQAIYNKFA